MKTYIRIYCNGIKLRSKGGTTLECYDEINKLGIMTFPGIMYAFDNTISDTIMHHVELFERMNPLSNRITFVFRIEVMHKSKKSKNKVIKETLYSPYVVVENYEGKRVLSMVHNATLKILNDTLINHDIN